MQVRLSAKALADIAAVRIYLMARNPRAARDTTSRLVAAITSLAAFPARGRRGLVAGTRELISVAPYIIVYKVDDETVEVVRIYHSAQDRA